MLRCSAQKIVLIITLVLVAPVYFAGFVIAKTPRRYPCDPKFGYPGNYLEISTGNIASARDILVCFGNKTEPEISWEKNWWEFWKSNRDLSAVKKKKAANACLRLATLPGRIQEANGEWTSWQKGVEPAAENTTFQFALCGSEEDASAWEEFHRNLGVDAWDDMRIVVPDKGEVMVEKLRVVQNRVRILDNESNEEGRVHFLLKGTTEGKEEIRLAERIRKTKLNRINCLNLQPGAPYCEQGVPGLEDSSEVSPVIVAALLELGHSGSKKYRRENDAYCSEFSLFVINKGVHLSDVCRKNIPNPVREDVNVRDMFRWFKSCDRLISREEIKGRIRPGDFISIDNLNHSAIFLGWADPEKNFFWEISGNNRCLPERETFYAPKNKANMVCISKRDFEKYVFEEDFGGIVEDRVGDKKQQ